jgi:hypothetical protein
MKRLIRVFPRRTNATPIDALAFVGEPTLFVPAADEVHISVTFTWDLPLAEKLAKAWERYGTVQIGGPATGMRGDEFTPGMYLRPGYTITSRGCPNRCWFCDVWKREGAIRELPIMDGWIVNDDNLLACSESHIRAVFNMLSRQPRRAEFIGGLEASRLLAWHVDEFVKLKPTSLWFACDEETDIEPLSVAGKLLREAGLSFTSSGNVSHRMRCYCLVGWPKDSMDSADKRLRTVYSLGFLPMAMLYRNANGDTDYSWRRFQRWWARPASINRMCRDCLKALP